MTHAMFNSIQFVVCQSYHRPIQILWNTCIQIHAIDLKFHETEPNRYLLRIRTCLIGVAYGAEKNSDLLKLELAILTTPQRHLELEYSFFSFIIIMRISAFNLFIEIC